MRWIILALSLGASTMSIMHGILIILGIFNPPEVAVWSAVVPPALLRSLPIISAFVALTGGVISFSSGRIGAVFLLTATVLCAFAPRDIWIYGIIYFLAAVLCFFLKKRQEQSDYYDYDFEDFESLNNEDDYEEGYGDNRANYAYGTNGQRSGRYNDYNDERENSRGTLREKLRDNLRDNRDNGYENRGVVLSHANIADRPVESDNKNDDALLESVGIIRRRAFKTCPKCGENVSPETRICPTCGEPLHVPEYAVKEAVSNDSDAAKKAGLNNININVNIDRDINKNIDNDTSKNIDIKDTENNKYNNDYNNAKDKNKDIESVKINNATEFKTESRDDDMQAVVQMGPGAAHRVFVNPRHDDFEVPRRPVNLDINPDKSYQEFGQYARRRKRGKNRSFGRRFLSFLLLFAVAGGALWFLLGLRDLPKDKLPPVNREPVARNERESESEDILVQSVNPVVDVTAETAENDLPYFAPERDPRQAVITRPGVNLREDHTTSSRSITKLSANTQADLLERWGGSGTGRTPGPWYKIRTGNREGWVYGDYVQQRGGSLPSGYSSALLRTFGSDKASLTANFGQARTSNNTTMEWPGVTATFRNNNLVRLRLNPGSQYELKNGLKPGLSRDELLNIMGYPSSISQRNYNYSESGKTGVSVELRNNNISSITVNDVQ